MKPRTLLVLFILVVALGSFIFFYEHKLPSSEERADLAKKVVPLKKEDIREVTLESTSGKVVLKRQEVPKAPPPKGGKEVKGTGGEELPLQSGPEVEWRLVQPKEARADTFAVDGLLDSLTGLEKTRTLDKVDRTATGLDKPRATVRIKTTDGETVLRLGAEVPTGGSLIAAVDGEAGAAVVSDSILSQVEKEPGSWRDRQLFRASRDAITRVTLTGAPGGPVVLSQKNGAFHLDRPLSDRADREKTDDLYADLSGLTAEKFLDDKTPAELGLAPPRAVVEVALDKGQPVRLELGAAAEAPQPPEPGAKPMAGPVYARIGSQLFEARTRLAEVALRPPAEWRARGLSSFEVYQIDSATVNDGKSTLQLTRAGTDWKRGDQTISYVPVSDFLFALTGAKADRLLTSDEAQALAAGAGKAALTVELKTKEAGTETLTLYPPLAAGTPARVSSRDVVLLLPADKLKEIQGKLADVKSAKPLAAK
jgi:Domain of unknown function (DUF4340)